MPYRRRQQDAAHAFAWPPTREDLDLIEIVDPDTLRPVHAQYNEPEPEQLDLLKAVTPVRPVRTPLPPPVNEPETNPAFASLVLLHKPEPLTRVKPPRRSQAAAHPPIDVDTQALVHVPAPGMLPFVQRRRLDPTWLIATCGLGAIALSAYFSLHPTSSTADVEAALTSTPVSAAPAQRLIARPLSSLELGWWPAIANAPPQRPPSQVVRGEPREEPKAAIVRKREPREPRQPDARNADARSVDARTVEAEARNAARNVEAEGRNAARNASLKTIAPAPEPLRSTPRLPAAAPASTSLAANVAPASTATPKPFASSAVTPTPMAPVAAPILDAKPTKLDLPAAPAPSAPPAVTHVPAAPVPDAKVAAVALPDMHQQVYAALKEYERGYEKLDAKAVRAVWPSVDARALARAFHDLKSQTLVFDKCDIDVARIQAIAACRGRATYETRVGDQALRTEPREWTFKLRKSDEAWQIVSASAR